MSRRKLAAYVHVGGRVYGPDDDVPDDVADQITNPAAWADSTQPAAAAEGGAGGGGEGPPPRTGKGSGKDAWAAYAAAQGVTVEADASRDDIIAALEAAGVATQEA